MQIKYATAYIYPTITKLITEFTLIIFEVAKPLQKLINIAGNNLKILL